MHVGIDLAWSNRARTGLAVVDGSGALVASSSVRSDEEIDAWLAGLGGSVVNVAIDAPLIVTNPTGMRQCERLVGRSYGRYDASCHASNLGVSYLNPPRAWTLALRHRWEPDPAHIGRPGAPAAIEVYPHAAMVGLFGLGRILKYKSGRIETRRAAFVELLDRMETLDVLALRENLRWQAIRQLAHDAQRPVELDRIEDEVDAILCAHLAWLWQHEPAALHVYGDVETGYIVAPPPPTHPPTPRPPTTPSRPASGRPPLPPSAAEPVTARPVPGDEARVAVPRLVSVVGRPSGHGGSGDESSWHDVVRAALSPHRYCPPTRLGIEIEFRLGLDQQGHEAPALDDLIRSTLDAFDGLLGPSPDPGRSRADDERIDRIVASKRPVRPGENPGATVVIWPLVIDGATGSDRSG